MALCRQPDYAAFSKVAGEYHGNLQNPRSMPRDSVEAAITAHRKVVAVYTSSFRLLANAEIGECREITDPILPFGGFRQFPDQD